jgi:hypothetical protein
MQEKPPRTSGAPKISEDWLAVLIAYILILLSVIGVLGKNGINIKF